MHTKQNKYLYSSFLLVLITALSIPATATVAASTAFDQSFPLNQSFRSGNSIHCIQLQFLPHFKSGSATVYGKTNSSFLQPQLENPFNCFTEKIYLQPIQKIKNPFPNLPVMRKQVNRQEWQN